MDSKTHAYTIYAQTLGLGRGSGPSVRDGERGHACRGPAPPFIWGTQPDSGSRSGRTVYSAMLPNARMRTRDSSERPGAKPPERNKGQESAVSSQCQDLTKRA